MSTPEVLVYCGVFALAAFALHLASSHIHRARNPTPRRRRARQNPPQAAAGGGAQPGPIVQPRRKVVQRTLSRLNDSDIEYLPNGPAPEPVTMAGPSREGLHSNARARSRSFAPPVAGPSGVRGGTPPRHFEALGHFIAEVSARAGSPLAMAIAFDVPASSADVALAQDAPASPSVEPSNALPDLPLAPPVRAPSVGPSSAARVMHAPLLPAEPSAPSDGPSSVSQAIQPRLASVEPDALSAGRSSVAVAVPHSRPTIEGSPITRTERKFTPKPKANESPQQVITPFWSPQVPGEYPIQSPPDLTGDGELVLGDVFFYPMEQRYQLWLWTSDDDGAVRWVAVRYGYPRDDGRRLIVTPCTRKPGWVSKETWNGMDHRAALWDAYDDVHDVA